MLAKCRKGTRELAGKKLSVPPKGQHGMGCRKQTLKTRPRIRATIRIRRRIITRIRIRYVHVHIYTCTHTYTYLYKKKLRPCSPLSFSLPLYPSFPVPGRGDPNGLHGDLMASLHAHRGGPRRVARGLLQYYARSGGRRVQKEGLFCRDLRVNPGFSR